MLLTRRNVLLSGAAMAGVSALGVPVAQLPPAAPGLRLLGTEEATLVAALGEAFFPPGNPVGVSAADVDLPLLVDELLAELLDPVVAPVFRYLLRAFDLGTWASQQAAFAGLPLEARRVIVETWADNDVLPRRLAYDSLKTILGMAFFNAPRVRGAIGFSAAACNLGAT